MTQTPGDSNPQGPSGISFPGRLEIPIQHWQSMLDHIRACLPEEGCGLLGGLKEDSAARVSAVLPIPNELRSPVRFRMDPAQQIKAFYWLENEGLELLAIFHSHPAGPAVPSPTDLAEFAYPGVLTLIWSPQAPGGQWRARAFALHPEQAEEVPVEVTGLPGGVSVLNMRG
jgi:proteasome lid subunit RPN8/RPN11